MTRRQTMLVLAKVAGYHNDSKAYTRLMVESRVGRPFLAEAWRAGVRARAAGVSCPCSDCKATEERRAEAEEYLREAAAADTHSSDVDPGDGWGDGR